MNIKFTRDFCGRETAMQEHKKGTHADIPNAQALELIKMGVAVEVWAEIGKMFTPPPPPVEKKRKVHK